MMLIIILLFISVVLNLALIFGFVRSKADDEALIIRLREGLKTE